MRSNEKLADHLKNSGSDVQLKAARPGAPETWYLKNRGNEVQLEVGRPGTPQTWHLKNRGT